MRTRSITLPTYISSKECIEAAALRLLEPELPIEIRLMGIRVSQFDTPSVSASQPRLDTFVKPRPARTVPAPAGVDRDAAASGQEDADRGAGQLDIDAERTGEAAAALAGGRNSRADDVEDYGMHEHSDLRSCEVLHSTTSRPGHDATVAAQRDGHLRLQSEGSGCADEAGPVAAADAPAAEDGGMRVCAAGSSACAAQAPVPGIPARAPLLPKGPANGAEPEPSEATGPGVRVCPKCGQSFSEVAWQEHADWHVAAELSTVVNGAGYLESRSRVSSGARGTQAREREVERQSGDGAEPQKRRRQSATPAPQSAKPRGLRAFFGSGP